MVELMKVPGKIIICMGKDHIHGATAESMKVNIIWIKSTDTEFITGLMVEDMKDTGKMGSNMGKGGTYCQMV